MKVVYVTLLSIVAGAQLAMAQPQIPDEIPDARPRAIQHGETPADPTARKSDADDELREQRRIARNQQRAAVLNQFLRKRGVSSKVVASVSAIDVFSPWEVTIGFVMRVTKAGLRKLPFGGGSYFNGLHPHEVKFKSVDGEREINLATCVLDFYTSRLRSDRVFIRSRSCSERETAYMADNRGFSFAGMVQLKNGQVVGYKDLSDTSLLFSDDRLPHAFADPDTFEGSRGRAPQPEDNGNGES